MRCSPLSFLFSAFVWLSALLLSGTAGATQLQVLTENLPPLNYQDNGTAQGYTTELVQAVLKQADVQAEIQFMPWARAYQQALSQPNTLIFSMTRTPERESLFDWIGPVSPRLIYLYKLRSRSDIVVRTLADCARYRIGAVREMASTKAFAKEAGLNEAQMELAPTVESNFRKFLLGRADLIISQDWSAAFMMKSLQRQPDELEPVLLLEQNHPYFLALNKQSDPALIQKLKQAFEKVQQSGLPEKLRNKYMR